MRFVLAPTAVRDGYRLEAFETVGSTNAAALEKAQAGDPGGIWLVSRDQRSGRGRRGRNWEPFEGNLAATLLLVDCCPMPVAATLGFVAGLAVAEALDACAGETGRATATRGKRPRFELKWPNDVLADGAKLCGILLESTMLSDRSFAVAIGIGVNVVAHPSDLPYPAASLRGLGIDCDAETLFLALSDAWVDAVHLWDGGRGLDVIRRRWLERAAGRGAEVAVRLEGEVVRGVFETIDEDCRFMVRDGDGKIWRIAAGDVHFGAVATAAVQHAQKDRKR